MPITIGKAKGLKRDIGTSATRGILSFPWETVPFIHDVRSRVKQIANTFNAPRLRGQPNPSPCVKDAFHRYVITGEKDAVNPAHTGTKAAAQYVLDVPAGGSKAVRLRLSENPTAFADFDQVFAARLADADEFYDRITPKSVSEDERRVLRQALAGMLWTKQYYYFDLDRWLNEHEAIHF